MNKCHVYNLLDELPQKNCESIAEAEQFIKEFVARYERQGYYSSRMKRYDLRDLSTYLQIRQNHSDYVIEKD